MTAPPSPVPASPPRGQPVAAGLGRIDPRLAPRLVSPNEWHAEGMRPRTASSRRVLPGSPFNNLQPVQEVERYSVQDRVTHDKYGLGRVVLVEPETVTVDFGSDQIRIGSPFNKLAKL